MINSNAIQTLFIAILQGFGALSILFMDVFIARLIGIEEYGLYATIISWVYILSIISTMGTNQLVLRYIPEYLSQNKFTYLHELLKACRIWICRLSGTILACGVVLVLVFDLSSHRLFAFIVGFLSIPMIAMSYLRQSALRALGHHLKALIPDFFIKPFLGFIFIFVYGYIVQKKLDAVSVLAITLLSIFVAYIVGAWWLKNRVSLIPKESYQTIDKKKWFLTSLYLFIVVSLNLLTYRIDILMISILGDATQVGVYAAASKVAEVVVFGLVCSNVIVVPLVAKYFSLNQMSELQTMLTKFTRLTFTVTFPVILIIVAYAKEILSIFGDGFTTGQYALIILVVGQMMSLICGPVGAVMMMTGHEKVAMKIAFISATFNFLLNLVLIPVLGTVGAAISTTISLFIINTFMVYYVKKLLLINTTVF